MSSTEDSLRAFYLAEIAPLQGKVELTMAGQTRTPDSYYIDRDSATNVQMDFAENLVTPEAIGAQLDAIWSGTALAGMGQKLAHLSNQIETSEDTGEVSDLVYEMF